MAKFYSSSAIHYFPIISSFIFIFWQIAYLVISTTRFWQFLLLQFLSMFLWNKEKWIYIKIDLIKMFLSLRKLQNKKIELFLTFEWSYKQRFHPQKLYFHFWQNVLNIWVLNIIHGYNLLVCFSEMRNLDLLIYNYDWFDMLSFWIDIPLPSTFFSDEQILNINLKRNINFLQVMINYCSLLQ